jgi:hypothetical protein
MTTQPSTTEQLNKFIEFRQWVYEQVLTTERDAQFDLITAILFSPAVQSFAELSLSPVFQRRWPSLYTAVERGRVDENGLRGYLTQQVPTQGLTVWALDTSVWPRPQTRTLAALRYEQSPTEAIQSYATVQGYAYSSLAWIPKRGRSWALSVDTRRVVGHQTVVEVGVEQVKTLCHTRPADTRDVITADGSYGNHRFLGALKDHPCTLLSIHYHIPPTKMRLCTSF